MCYRCSTQLDFTTPIARSAVCPSCGADVRCCKNCNLYSIGSHYDCKENIDERIVDKERANFCDWFSLNTSCGRGIANSSKVDDAKVQFNSLFGD